MDMVCFHDTSMSCFDISFLARSQYLLSVTLVVLGMIDVRAYPVLGVRWGRVFFERITVSTGLSIEIATIPALEEADPKVTVRRNAGRHYSDDKLGGRPEDQSDRLI